MEWFVFVAALVFVYVMSRHSNKTTSTRGAAERDHDSDSNLLPHSEAAPNAHRAPSTYLARWAVLYNDIEGAKTERVVRILEVHPRLQNFRVWCELRQAERTLSFWGIRQVADAETGELIDFEGWMTEYRRARAAKAKAARDAQL